MTAKLDRAVDLMNKAMQLLAEVRAEQAGEEKWKGIPPASGCRGVAFEKRTGKWTARAWDGKKMRWIGTFASFEDAKSAVEEASISEQYVNRTTKNKVRQTAEGAVLNR
jgi:hypothetical protein